MATPTIASGEMTPPHRSTIALLLLLLPVLSTAFTRSTSWCRRSAPVVSGATVRNTPVRAEWDTMYNRLVEYKQVWGHADATLADELGRWCQGQRRMRSQNRLRDSQVAALDAIGFSWASPSAPEDVFASWDERVAALAEYVARHGDGQVPKKFKDNPALGGWVAAVRRRGRVAYDKHHLRQLDDAGFEWVSTRVCGSKFMQNFRELRDFHAIQGHSNPPQDTPLATWCSAQRRAAAKGKLSDQRLDYLRSINFDFGMSSAEKT